MRISQQTRAFGRRVVRSVAVTLLLGAVAVRGVGAQQPTTPTPTVQTPADASPVDVSPRGAFVRALAFPGWGHSALGAHVRGGFYFAVEAATAFTYLRSRMRLSEARERVAFRETFLRDRLALEGIADEPTIQERLDADPVLAELQSLEESRSDQREDMVALGIFMLFLSGADAYVSAHLSRFPEPLELDAQPTADGRFELSLRVPLPR